MATTEQSNVSMETIVSLCKRRGFIYQSSEIYGGLGSVWDYGPLGVELKNNVKRSWWKTVVQEREDMVGLDAAILMHPRTWEALGPVEEDANVVYLRPETAQGIFVNFANVLTVTRKKLPFGIAQIGKSFRNEVTPRHFIFRTREFEKMECDDF